MSDVFRITKNIIILSVDHLRACVLNHNCFNNAEEYKYSANNEYFLFVWFDRKVIITNAPPGSTILVASISSNISCSEYRLFYYSCF